MSISDLNLRIKKLFPLLRVKSHLTMPTGRQAAAGIITFSERLWPYFSTLLRRCLESVGPFLAVRPEFRDYIEAVSNAFRQMTPLKGCELEL